MFPLKSTLGQCAPVSETNRSGTIEVVDATYTILRTSEDLFVWLLIYLLAGVSRRYP